MNSDRAADVERYLDDALLERDDVLDAVIAATAAAGMRPINVAPSQGKFLHILSKAIGARRILELGTMAGYSGIWLARALPDDGLLVTIESEESHAAVARQSFARAGVTPRVDLRIGRALDVLPDIEGAGIGPFDLVFIDADRPRYAEYFDWAVRLSRPGSLIVVDNVVRDGAVVDETSTDAGVHGVRRFMEAARGDRRVAGTALQTVGAKGYDGFVVLLVAGTATRAPRATPDPR